MKFSQRVSELFVDQKAGEMKPLFWTLVGVALALPGLTIFTLDFIAAIEGHSTVMVSRRSGSTTTMPVEVRMLFDLILATSGMATVWRGLTLTYPTLGNRRWFRWSARLVLGPLVLIMLALAALVIVGRIVG